MRHQLILFASVGIIMFFVLLNVNIPSPTGGFLTKTYAEEESQTYSMQLHRRAKNFFQVADIVFPPDSCGYMAQELYGNIAFKSVQVTEGFQTNGAERLSTLSFVVDFDDVFGTIDFVRSPRFLAEQNSDNLISISTEAIVRLPKSSRTTYYAMDLYGVSDTFYYVTRGRFSTPTVDCVFVVENGDTMCDCDIHTISGIAVAGITEASAVETRYQDLLRRVKNETPSQPLYSK